MSDLEDDDSAVDTVTVGNEPDHFLAAEQTVQLLAEDLKRLQEQTRAYRNANVSLIEARQQLGDLVKSLTEIAKALQLSIDESVRTGIPELMVRLNDSLKGIRDLSLRLIAFEGRHAEATEETTTAIGVCADTIAETSRDVRAIQEAIRASEAARHQSATELASSLEKTNTAFVLAIQSSIRRILWIVALVLVATFAGLVLNVPIIRSWLGW